MTTATLDIARDRLRHIWGHADFRGRQPDVIERVLAGRDTLAVMPTGAGKSVTYQLPALIRQGTGLVVSPLIALMHDQVAAARALGIRAAALTSADSDGPAVARAFSAGELDLLYVAPERATNEGFQRLLERTPLSLIAVDEAHCVSEWGHDFRPDYRLLRPLLDRFDAPRVALTATADAATRADILRQLGIPQDGLVLAGFDRPNITYAIRPRGRLSAQLAQVVRDHPGPGIVYAPTRAATERLAAGLSRDTGRPTRAYHAGLPAEERAANQSAFVASEDMVMVATVAFGMGIDKPDVRFVAHAALPKSIESYYQETGRAGRDGDPAAAHLFWGGDDFARARQRLGEMGGDRIAGERARLDALGALVETPGCRRAVLLRHFGEHPPERCGACDTCLDPPRTIDRTDLARKLLSAVYRTGQSWGLTHLTEVLTGKASAKVRDKGHDALGVFGLVDGAEAGEIAPVARALVVRDALRLTEHGGYQLGPEARPLLKAEAALEMVDHPKPLRSARRSGGDPNPAGDPLFEALRATRKRLASEGGVPPYVVFHDSALRAMVADRPATRAALARVPGVGDAKLERYGDAFLQVLRDHG